MGRLRGGSREKHLESAAAPHLAPDFDPALVLFDDAIDSGEAQTSTFADFLCGKERFKDAFEGFGIHTAAGIANRKADEPARAGIGMAVNVVVVNGHGGGG